MNKIGVCLILLLLSSCISQKKCFRKYPSDSDTTLITIIRDTVINRDTLIFVHLPGEIRTDSIIIPCNPVSGLFLADTARAETSLAIAKAYWKYPFIKLQLVQKDTTIERRLRDAIREKIHWQSEYQKIKEVQIKTEVPGIYKIAIGGWVGVIVMIILVVVLKLSKFI